MQFPDVGEFAKRLRVGDNDLRGAIRLLLDRQFLYRGDHGTAKAYDILTSSLAGPVFGEIFDWLGYRFYNRNDQNWIGLLPDDESDSGARVSLDNTILILMLGFIFNQSREYGRYGTVMTTYMDIYNAYSDHLRMATPQRTKLAACLVDLKRRGIVDFDADAANLENAEIEIRPMLSALLPVDLAERIQAYADKRRAKRNNRMALKLSAATAGTPADAPSDETIEADND